MAVPIHQQVDALCPSQNPGHSHCASNNHARSRSPFPGGFVAAMFFSSGVLTRAHLPVARRSWCLDRLQPEHLHPITQRW